LQTAKPAADPTSAFPSAPTTTHFHWIAVLPGPFHTPLLHDRALAIENARYVFGYARHFFEEFDLKKGGLIETRANDVLQQSVDLLEHIEHVGLMTAISEGTFGRVRRMPTSGKGLDGVVAKGPQHFNPFFDLILKGGER